MTVASHVPRANRQESCWEVDEEASAGAFRVLPDPPGWHQLQTGPSTHTPTLGRLLGAARHPSIFSIITDKCAHR